MRLNLLVVASTLILGGTLLVSSMVTTTLAQVPTAVQAKCECCKGRYDEAGSGKYIGPRAVDRCNALKDGACKGTAQAKIMCTAKYSPRRGAKCCLHIRGKEVPGTITAAGFCRTPRTAKMPSLTGRTFSRPPCK